MTSLASLPQLRRTITDIMEDELYSLPHSNSPNHHQLQSAHGPFSHFNRNSAAACPLTANSMLAPNNNTNLSSFFNLPESFVEQCIREDESNHQAQLPQQSQLHRKQQYYDTPDDARYDDMAQDVNPFNEYANPDLFYTSSNFQGFEIPDAPAPLTVAPVDAHLKVPEEVMNFSTNYYLNDDASKFYVWPNQTNTTNEFTFNPNDELFDDDDISDDDMDEDDDRLYDEIPEDGLYNFDNTSSTSIILDDEIPSHLNDEFNETSSVISTDSSYFDSSVDNNKTNFDHQLPSPSESPVSSPSLSATSSMKFKKEQSSALPPNVTELNHSTLSHQQAFNLSKSPHQCHLMNPNTHQACMKEFSRPYDLIRHQETIHASRKKIFKCIICESEHPKSGKTFSRGDALSRHIRVKHGLSGVAATNAINYAKENVEYV